MARYFLILLCVGIVISASCIGIFYYAKIVRKLKNDIVRILSYVICGLLCFSIPLFFLEHVFRYFDIKKDSWERFIILAIWILPVLIVGLNLKKRGYFNIESQE